ncbi:hypothetical protein H257_00522 [Aphanomyces astaci]|uniref:Tyrosine specific protein phosphatases domain-containing protein n=1 Tax=Aphanomyces astaci TaxID=112090 RepID=W4HDF2_APHAT|nr:hypothetical protein H257_00522 [Aphanomyces astaci]ETV89153.1 hypothetical protein H257_00522 [Aphanomyces astaci]|eukprot:XP_009821553.1 hypothetical protein H257_00522 [Aphanomyces astaci]
MSEGSNYSLPPQTPSGQKKFNFGQAWADDAYVYGAERPGYMHPRRDQPSTPRGPDVSDKQVQEWINFMLINDIKHVLCLLTREELRFYSTPLLPAYEKAFTTVTHVDLAGDWRLSGLLASLTQATAAKERIVVHCTTGQTRAANVLAMWLHRTHAVGIDDAIHHVLETASLTGTMRNPTADGVLRLLRNVPATPLSSARSLPPPPVSLTSLPRTSFSSMPAAATAIPATPASTDPPDICFVHLGGCIDATLSRFVSNFHLDVGPPVACASILSAAGSPAALDSISICRKGHDVTTADLDAVVAALNTTRATLVVITMDVSVLWTTAAHLQPRRRHTQTIVCTGARVPACIPSASDAAFNLGCSLGAIRWIPPGVYVSLNGRVVPVQDDVASPQACDLMSK